MKKFLKQIISLAPDKIYAIMLTSRFIFNREKITVKSEENFLLVKDSETPWWTHRKRVHLYSQGLASRGESIGKSYLLSYIPFKRGDVVIDCGANMGDLLLYFKNREIDVNYFGLEPNPIDYKCLQRNCSATHSALNLALWNKSTSLTFFVDTDSASSSLIEPPTFTEKVSVNCARLDDLVFPEKIKLFKVEGEGAEPEILEGARGMFRRIEYISVDAGPERGIQQTPTKNDVLKVLENSNFELVMENPYHRKTMLFRNSAFK